MNFPSVATGVRLYADAVTGVKYENTDIFIYLNNNMSKWNSNRWEKKCCKTTVQYKVQTIVKLNYVKKKKTNTREVFVSCSAARLLYLVGYTSFYVTSFLDS